MIYLIGFMGTGKTTVSEILAKKTGLSIIDSDKYIEKKSRRKIPDIFANEGEDYFRDLETRGLREVSEAGYGIISCGGGIVLRSENIEIMKSNGQIFCLTASPETIFERVKGSTQRPLLNGNMNVEHIRSRLSARKKYYDSADAIKIKTDGKTPDEVADEIISLMEKKLSPG